MSLDGTTLSDVIDTFEVFDDWEDRYRYLIELGRKLPPYPEEARTEAHKVRGCVSQVWLNPHFSDDTPPKLHLTVIAMPISYVVLWCL